jgi:hypothetical protein
VLIVRVLGPCFSFIRLPVSAELAAAVVAKNAPAPKDPTLGFRFPKGTEDTRQRGEPAAKKLKVAGEGRGAGSAADDKPEAKGGEAKGAEAKEAEAKGGEAKGAEAKGEEKEPVSSVGLDPTVPAQLSVLLECLDKLVQFVAKQPRDRRASGAPPPLQVSSM